MVGPLAPQAQSTSGLTWDLGLRWTPASIFPRPWVSWCRAKSLVPTPTLLSLPPWLWRLDPPPRAPLGTRPAQCSRDLDHHLCVASPF